MAKRGKPLGNKRQRERDKRRKKEEKAARRAQNSSKGTGPDGEPLAEGEAEDEAGVLPEEPNEAREAGAESDDDPRPALD